MVIGQPIANLKQIAVGFLFVVVGLGMFLLGLEQTLFPLGKLMAEQLTDPAFLHEHDGQDRETSTGSDYYWVYCSPVRLASDTLAEPALIAVSMKANPVSGGAIGVWGLRVAVAIGVGIRVGLGCYRIITGTASALFYRGGLLRRDSADDRCAQVDRAAGLRFGRRIDIHRHSTFDNRARPGPVRSRTGSQRIT